MNSFLTRRSAVLSLVLFSSLLLVIPSIYQAARINNWSLHYFQGIYKGEQQEPAVGHPRQEIWQALSALSIQDWQAAIDLLSPLVVQENKFGIELLGRAFEGAGDYSAALQAYRYIGNIQGLLHVAATASQAGDVNTTFVAYKAAWEEDPIQNTTSYADFLWYKKKDYEAAENVLRQGLTIPAVTSRRIRWYNRLIGLLISQKKRAESERVIEEAIREYPNETQFYVNLGWHLYHDGLDFDSAFKQFQYAISIDNKRGEGQLAIASLYVREGLYQEADKWYQEALNRETERVELYLLRANTVRGTGDYLKAIELYHEILDLFPEYSKTFYELAWVYHLNQQPEEAIFAIEKARNMWPDREYIHVRAGEIYEAVGDKEKAIIAFRLALDLQPDNKNAQRGLKRLTDD